MRTGENWRESWWIKNVTNKTIAIGDLHLLPSLKPNQQVDVLRYYTRERISHAKTLVALLKSGKLKLNKEKIFTNAFPGEISATEADEAVTPAEENEIAYSGTSSHEHDNEDILDGFDEDSSGLIWNGQPIQGAGTEIHNDLLGLQGGDEVTNEFYHLDFTKYDTLTGGPDKIADNLHSHSGIANIDGGYPGSTYGGGVELLGVNGGDPWGNTPSV